MDMDMHRALDFLANELFLLSTQGEEFGGPFRNGVPINLKHTDEGQFLWGALETAMILPVAGPPVPHDIVTEDVIPDAKRVTITIELSTRFPQIRVVVDRPLAGKKGGPYSATFDLVFPKAPPSLKTNDLFSWMRNFLMSVYPKTPNGALENGAGPTGIAFVDQCWPDDLLPPEAFGIDEIRVTTFFDPKTKEGGVESTELVFSTPETVQPPPLPYGIPDAFLFRQASREGVSVELHFDRESEPTLAQIDGAILLEYANKPVATLPLQWISRVPTLFAGSFDAEAEYADPPFPLGALGKPLADLRWILEGSEHLLIHQAELTCDLGTGAFDFIGQCVTDEVEIAGLQCTDVVITFKWHRARQGPVPDIAVLRGIALLAEETYFRAALVWRKGVWISAIEANHSSQTWDGAVPLAQIVEALPRFAMPERFVNDSSAMPELLLLEEQRRGTQNDFDELIGET